MWNFLQLSLAGAHPRRFSVQTIVPCLGLSVQLRNLNYCGWFTWSCQTQWLWMARYWEPFKSFTSPIRTYINFTLHFSIHKTHLVAKSTNPRPVSQSYERFRWWIGLFSAFRQLPPKILLRSNDRFVCYLCGCVRAFRGLDWGDKRLLLVVNRIGQKAHKKAH